MAGQNKRSLSNFTSRLHISSLGDLIPGRFGGFTRFANAENGQMEMDRPEVGQDPGIATIAAPEISKFWSSLLIR